MVNTKGVTVRTPSPLDLVLSELWGSSPASTLWYDPSSGVPDNTISFQLIIKKKKIEYYRALLMSLENTEIRVHW